MKACIISIGEELLIGQTINTNAAWIASRLNSLGIETREIVVITDDHAEILRSLKTCGERADIIIITGGLGPTRDDVTKHALCAYFDTKLVMSEQILADVKDYLAKRGRTINELNRQQALVPEKARLMPNPYGTAPGLWFEEGGKSFIAMPGVPYEMREMVEKHVLPGFRKLPRQQYILHKTVLTHGIGESDLAQLLSSWEDELHPSITLAYLPSMGIVKLRLTARGTDEEQLQVTIADEIHKLSKHISKYIWGFDDDSMEKKAGELLNSSKHTLAIAESCTGGFTAHQITSVPGSSDYFRGSIVAYDNRVKIDILGVEEETIRTHGAVSKQVAEQMAEGAKKALQADYAIGITGIAGPDGGSKDKPVGTTWIAVAGRQLKDVQHFVYADNRERNIIRANKSAMMMLIKLIKKESQ